MLVDRQGSTECEAFASIDRIALSTAQPPAGIMDLRSFASHKVLDRIGVKQIEVLVVPINEQRCIFLIRQPFQPALFPFEVSAPNESKVTKDNEVVFFRKTFQNLVPIQFAEVFSPMCVTCNKNTIPFS